MDSRGNIYTAEQRAMMEELFRDGAKADTPEAITVKAKLDGMIELEPDEATALHRFNHRTRRVYFAQRKAGMGHNFALSAALDSLKP